MRKYWKVYINVIQDALAERTKLMVYILSDFLPPSISIVLWIGIYHYSGTIRSGWELNQLVSYYLTVTFFSLALNHFIEFSIGNWDINQGRLVNYLIKPISYLKYTFIGSCGWKTVRLAVSFLPFFLLFFAFRQYWQISASPATVLISFGFAAIAYLMIFFYKFLLGIAAFWTVDNYGIVNFFWMIQALFSGLLVPFDFLPNWLKNISFFLPFRFFYYLPSMLLVNGRSSTNFMADLSIELGWLILLAILSRYLFRKGLERFSDIRQ